MFLSGVQSWFDHTHHDPEFYRRVRVPLDSRYKHSGMTDWEPTSRSNLRVNSDVEINRTALRTLNVLGMNPNDDQLIRREQLILAIRGQSSGTKV